MDFYQRCDAWFVALPDELKADACSAAGVVPDWMVVSLARVGIPVISVEMTGGDMRTRYLMPTGLTLYLRDVAHPHGA